MAKKYQVNLDTLEVPDFDSDDETAPPQAPKKEGSFEGESELKANSKAKAEKSGEKKKKVTKKAKAEKLDDEDDEAAALNKGFTFDLEDEGRSADADWNFLYQGEKDEKNADEESDDDSDDDDDDGENEDEDDDEEDEEDDSENEENDDAQDNDLQKMSKGKLKNPDEEEDSAEAIAEFFEASKVASATSSNDADKIDTSFASLQLSRPILKSLAELNYIKPTPIQRESIPIALLGKDIVAGAETGSGKTAAYMIPIIERLLYKPSKVNMTRVVVLTPTRELSIQVSDVTKRLAKYASNITMGLAVGGLNLRKQEQELKSKPDIVIATPGRFIDHIRNSPSFNVENVEVLVMDEADRMLEEGFQKELTEILSLLPKKRQSLLFSATMNSRIKSLIQLSLNKPVRIMINPPNKAASRLTQEFVRIRKRDSQKPALLYNILSEIDPKQQHRIVVFVARKETAHKLKIILQVLGLKAGELHGALSQEQRLMSVTSFKNLSVPILICTDLAARGLDIPKIEFVINFDMPKSYEIYLHRVGRTARANREGKSISFVGESAADRTIVKDALKSLAEKQNMINDVPAKKAVSRTVDWKKVEDTNSTIENRREEIQDVTEMEKQKKELEVAERELKKGENLLKYQDEIKARPRRTWFESEKDKKQRPGSARGAIDSAAAVKTPKKVNRQKRKRLEEQSEGYNTGLLKKSKKDSKKKDVKPVSKKGNKKAGKKY